MRKTTEDRLKGLTAEWSFPLDFTRLPTQTQFIFDFAHECQALGGGVGTGKTTGALAKCFFLSFMIPGSVGLIARWDGKELRQTTMMEFYNLVPKAMLESRNDQMGVLKFKAKYGGSTIFYGDLKETRAINNYNLSWAYVDQCEEIDQERWDLLLTRTRRKIPIILDDGPAHHPTTGAPLYYPNFNFGTFNPEGTSSYIWRYFHPDSPEKKPNYQLYQSTTYDGLAAGFVTKEYVDRLLAVYPENARRRYLEGAWDVFSGRVYPAFDTQVHVVPAMTPKPHWLTYETIDHGLQNPTAVLWIAVDEDENWYILDEHYEGNGKPVQYHALCIKARRAQLGTRIQMSWMDAHCWARDQSRGDTVFSVADEYLEHGIVAIPGQKSWDVSYNRILEHLWVDPAHRHPFTGELGAPRLYVAAHCTNTIREFLSYKWKKQSGTILRNQPDIPIDHDDHAMDALAYFAASGPTAPILRVDAPGDILAELAARRKTWNPLTATVPTGGSWMSF